MSNWEYRARRPNEGAAFDAAMTANSRAFAAVISASYDFSAFDVVADVGGGQGVLLSTILDANPSLRGILFDRPRAVSDGSANLQVAGLPSAARLWLVTSSNSCQVAPAPTFSRA